MLTVHKWEGTQMIVQGIAEESTPTRHSVLVNWFLRDPGGTAVFVVPADDDEAAQRAERH